MQMAAIYTRVSSDRQREAHTIASQTAALVEWAPTLDLEVPRDWVFEDDGYSGATLERPGLEGLERVRDLAAAGDIQVVLVHSPDRLSRKYAYQVLLIEELGRHGVETRFLNAPSSATAEDQLLVQFQGMIAEYERAQISPAPTTTLRNSRGTTDGNTVPAVDSGGPSAPRRTPRTIPPRRRRSLPPPGPGSDARRTDAPRSSEGLPSSPTSATAVEPPVSCPSPWLSSVRNSTDLVEPHRRLLPQAVRMVTEITLPPPMGGSARIIGLGRHASWQSSSDHCP